MGTEHLSNDISIHASEADKERINRYQVDVAEDGSDWTAVSFVPRVSSGGALQGVASQQEFEKLRDGMLSLSNAVTRLSDENDKIKMRLTILESPRSLAKMPSPKAGSGKGESKQQAGKVIGWNR